ncbi:hypothetical protein EXIGLDRAFT_839119 [Exidia glandulosa HHB12029]|uniref:ChrR-like cupin domain-containing protein n=1 Tax=Exidia glandulosa HHB12029 TaxID=1314781 RepID=A0A165F8Q9_EXIGL|nr:hypothetical protein EXIGLDRAFT_839119 [Exidia glandulosa HHB12029]
MPKPELEFTPVEAFPLVPSSDTATLASVRTLSHDPETKDATIILYHAPGQQWGGAEGKETPAVHEYWEEVLILKGRLYDKTLGKWFGEKQYCCRPPGMVHGPWIADETQGCEEIVFIRHETRSSPSSTEISNNRKV